MAPSPRASGACGSLVERRSRLQTPVPVRIYSVAIQMHSFIMHVLIATVAQQPAQLRHYMEDDGEGAARCAALLRKQGNFLPKISITWDDCKETIAFPEEKCRFLVSIWAPAVFYALVLVITSTSHYSTLMEVCRSFCKLFLCRRIRTYRGSTQTQS